MKPSETEYKGSWDRYKHTNPMGSAMGKAGLEERHTLNDLTKAASVAGGHAAGWHLAAAAMGIDWMNRATLTQAIPPVMTEWIGKQLLAVLGVSGATQVCHHDAACACTGYEEARDGE